MKKRNIKCQLKDKSDMYKVFTSICEDYRDVVVDSEFGVFSIYGTMEDAIIIEKELNLLNIGFDWI